ncbi:hypothetical protein DFJ74DRAFT_706592 [Hyaloraphidium curvatum]|nr:hypothetical protein DFJ74DRAFT_706592 [Hyaloraphidium curvatum]
MLRRRGWLETLATVSACSHDLRALALPHLLRDVHFKNHFFAFALSPVKERVLSFVGGSLWQSDFAYIRRISIEFAEHDAGGANPYALLLDRVAPTLQELRMAVVSSGIRTDLSGFWKALSSAAALKRLEIAVDCFSDCFEPECLKSKAPLPATIEVVKLLSLTKDTEANAFKKFLKRVEALPRVREFHLVDQLNIDSKWPLTLRKFPNICRNLASATIADHEIPYWGAINRSNLSEVRLFAWTGKIKRFDFFNAAISTRGELAFPGLQHLTLYLASTSDLLTMFFPPTLQTITLEDYTRNLSPGDRPKLAQRLEALGIRVFLVRLTLRGNRDDTLDDEGKREEEFWRGLACAEHREPDVSWVSKRAFWGFD